MMIFSVLVIVALALPDTFVAQLAKNPHFAN